jgi:hypothetical protein
MANELTLSGSLAFAKGSVSAALSYGPLTLTVTGTRYKESLQEIGTSAEAIEVGDLATTGYCILVNRDPTNYVTIRNGVAGADLVKLKAGEFAIFRLATTTPYALANTDAVELQVLILSD